MQIENITLKNGLNTLFINSPGSTSASVQIWFRAGSSLESKEDFGIAHFLEHMFFKGTEKRPGAKIAHDVESYGGEVNAFTSFDYTCYYINTPFNQINKTIEILMDMVSNPLFLESEIAPERGVVFEEFRRAYDNPNQFNFKEIQKTCFTGGYKHQILGTEKNIKNFSRKQLTDFRNKYYNLSNAMLIVSGDLKKINQFKTTIEKFKLPKGPKTEFKKFKLASTPKISIHQKDVKQATLTICIDAPHYEHKNAPSEELALNCFSYGEMAPLYNRLVTETKLASGVSASTMYFQNGGTHFLRFICPEKNIEKILKVFHEVYAKIIKDGFKDEEVSRITNQYIASKIYEKENLESYSFSLGHSYSQNGDIYSEEKFLEKIKKVSTKEIDNSLFDIFNRKIHIILQLPKSEPVEGKKELLLKFQNDFKKFKKENETTQKNELSKYDSLVQVVTLKNGIKLVHRHNPMTQTFVLHTYLKGGQSYEKKTTQGHYQLLARLLTNGYTGISFKDLKLDLENKSASFSGFSGKNAYGLTLHGQSIHRNELFTHFFNSLLNPEIENKFLSLEKELIYRSLKNFTEDPLKQCFREVTKAMFNNHPYSMHMIGSKETIKEATSESLLKEHKKRLRRSPMVITYCGSEDLNAIQGRIELLIKTLKPREDEKIVSKTVKPIIGHKKHIEFNREQTHIFIGRPAYKVGAVEDLYIKMLNAHLSGQSSELFVEVRDRQGLCYSVQALAHTALEAGYWGIYIGAGKDKSDAAKDAILGIVKRLQAKGFTTSQFNRVKKMIDGQNLLNIQTNDDYANFYSIPVLHNLGLDYQHKSFEKIRNFNVQDFNKFLNKFLDFDWTIIEVGPKN